MALPTSTNDVTARKLGSVINSLWTKIKSTFVKKSGDTMTGRLTLEKPISQVITGTGTAATTSGSGSSTLYYPALWKFNLGIATPTAGDKICIRIPVAGHDYGVFISTDNGTTYFPVARHTGKSRLGTQYPNGAYICVVFEGAASGITNSGCVDSCFPPAGATARQNYTSGCWRVINDYDSGNSVNQLRHENGRFYAGSTGCNPYSLICLDKDNKFSMLISSGSGTGTSKTINTSGKFKLSPVILYYNANNTAAANARVSSTYATYNALTAIDTRYSHNHTTTFSVDSPLYIECTIDEDGFWSPTTKCITQTLESGKYYIFLGLTYSTEYQLCLMPYHPLYYYDGTNLTEVPRLSKADRTKLDGIASGATKVESSSTNGKIKINGTDTTVYTHPTQTAYSAKGSATKVPKITTDSTGHVTSIEEVTITGTTPASHSHGNIANGGTLTDTAAAAAGNDYVVIRDADNNKVQTSTIKGTDVADAVSKKHSHSTLTLSTTAQAYDGTHTLALPSSDPYTSARTPTSHTHGNIANGGTLTDTAAAAAGNDYVVIRDADNAKIQTSTIKGTDVADAVSKKHSHSTLTLSTTAQAYDGSHTLALPSTDPYTSARTPTSHTHGNITNGGALQTNDITIASGDKLVVTDSSDSNKVARTSVSFDGSTTTTALTPKGTFEAFAKSGDISTAIGNLDAEKTSTDGTNVQVKVTEADGKISAVNITTDTTANRNEGVYYVAGTTDYPAWVANHAYAVNDNAISGGKAYFCKTAHTSGSSFDSSKWTAIVTPVIKGTITGVTAMYAGLKIALKWPITGGTSSTYLNINNLGNVYIRRNDGNITTHLPANSVSFLAYDGTYWRWADYDSNTNNWVTTMGAYCDTAAGTQAKVATSTSTVYTAGESFLIRIVNANTYNGKITLNINSQGAKDVWINGAVSSSSNKTLPAGEHWCHYDGSVFHIWTDGTAQFTKLKAGTFTGNVTGNVTGDVTGNASTATNPQTTLLTSANDLNDIKGDGIGVWWYRWNSGSVPTNAHNTSATSYMEVVRMHSGNYLFQIVYEATNSNAYIRICNNGTWGSWYRCAKTSELPEATTTTPKMDGTAAVGSETTWAKGDHVHPSDTSRVPTTRKVNGHALSADVTVTAADVSAVRYDTNAQGLTDTQKGNARTNIGAGTSNLALGTSSTTAAKGDHTHSVKINGSTKTIAASGGTAVDLGTFKNFKYAKVYAVTAYNASSARYFLLAERETTYTGNWQDTSEFKLTAYPGSIPKYMVFRLSFSGTKTTCSTPKVYELYAGGLDSNGRKVVEVRYTTSVVENTSITVHTYIYIDRNYLQSQWTSFQLEPLSMGTGDRSNNIDNGLTCWSYKTAETYVTSLTGTTVAHSSETINATVSNASSATSATTATQDSDGNAINTTYFKSSGDVTLTSGSATKIGTQNGADVKITLPTIPAAANNGALQIQLNGGTATSKFTANQSGNSTLAFSTGSTAGTFKVDSTEIAIAGFTKVESSSTNGKIKINGTDTTVYTHPTTEGNKHVPSGGSSGQFLGWDSAGTAKWVSNPNTDTKQRIVASDSKTYLTGVTTAPTSSNQDLTGVANTNVYATAGQLHATTFDVNSKCTLQFNTTTNALDFVFN